MKKNVFQWVLFPILVLGLTLLVAEGVSLLPFYPATREITCIIIGMVGGWAIVITEVYWIYQRKMDAIGR